MNIEYRTQGLLCGEHAFIRIRHRVSTTIFRDLEYCRRHFDRSPNCWFSFPHHSRKKCLSERFSNVSHCRLNVANIYNKLNSCMYTIRRARTTQNCLRNLRASPQLHIYVGCLVLCLVFCLSCPTPILCIWHPSPVSSLLCLSHQPTSVCGTAAVAAAACGQVVSMFHGDMTKTNCVVAARISWSEEMRSLWAATSKHSLLDRVHQEQR